MLPYPKITKIPEHPEPMADVPVWNSRYGEMDANFENLDRRMQALAYQLADIQPMTGVVTFKNRGVIVGAEVTKSTSATRNISLAPTQFFLLGQIYHMDTRENTAVIPPNPTNSNATATIYLHLDDNGMPQCDCTNLDQEAPDDAVAIWSASIPAHNDENSDPHLTRVELEKMHRTEPNWPAVQNDAPKVWIRVDERLHGREIQYLYKILEPTSPNAGEVVFIPMTHSNSLLRLELASSADPVTAGWSIRAIEETP